MKTKGKTLKTKIVALLLSVLMIFTSAPSLFVFAAEALEARAAADEESPRLDLNFNKNWKFFLGDSSNYSLTGYNDSAWEDVNLPHDFSISQNFTISGTEGESGNLPGGTGWYRKTFTFPATYSGKSIVLTFDGSYMNTTVYVNGNYVGENHYGYNAFSFDITDQLVFDGKTENVVAVRVNNTVPSSRWYSGSGIYRDVTMTITDPVHVSLYGTQVTTSETDLSDGTATAKITLQNDGTASKTVKVKASIIDADGSVKASAENASVTLGSGASTTVTLAPTFSNPKVWGLDNPNLYTLRTEIYENDVLIDSYDTTYGYRTIEWDNNNGFKLNGNFIKLQGVCLHHDQGALGAVQEYDSLYRQIAIMKDMGVNAVRITHNPGSRIILDICNELGMLVMEEFYDGILTEKNGNSHDFSEYYNVQISSNNNILGKKTNETWAEFVLTQTVKRDRNDPSIIIWDIANELNQCSGFNGNINSNFYNAVGNAVSWLKALDSTREVTQGNNTSVIMNVDNHMTVIGANYHPENWVNYNKQKPFVSTEASSAVSSRGVYYNVYNDKTDQYDIHYADEVNDQINSYDTQSVSWGATSAKAWYYTITQDWYSGEFIWTGFDYIGEPTPWNYTGTAPKATPNSSYFGAVDTAGFPKDMYYLYRSWWNHDSTTLHLLPGTWNKSSLALDNGYVDVAVYSNAYRIELYLGDTLIGSAQSVTVKTPAGYTYQTWTETSENSTLCKVNSPVYSDKGADFYSQFQVKYDANKTLSVKAYDENNQLITDTVGTTSVKANTANEIVASVWNNNTTLTADSDSLAYIEIEARDAEGNFVNDYNGKVNITLNGAGEIVGVDNGNAATTAKFQQSSVLTGDKSANIELFNGKALVVVRSTEETGDITVTIDPVDGKADETVRLTSVNENGTELRDEFEEVVDQTKLPTTQEDDYNELKNKIDALEAVSDSTYNTYKLYTPTIRPEENTPVQTGNLPDGTYVIKGQAYWGTDPKPDHSTGALTYTTNVKENKNGLDTDNTSVEALPAASDPSWTFAQQPNGTYHISTSNGTYMNISSSGITLSSNPQQLYVTVNADSTVVISDGESNAINFYGTAENYDFASVWTEGTPLVLYKVDGSTVSKWESEGVQEVITETQIGFYNADGTAGTMRNDSMGNFTDVFDVLIDGIIPTVEGAPTPEQAVWTGVNQVVGQYFLVELPKAVTMDEVFITAPAHNASVCQADVMISENGSDWTTVGEYKLDNINTAANQSFEFSEQSVKYIKVQVKALQNVNNTTNRFWIMSEIGAKLNGTTLDLRGGDPLGSGPVENGRYVLVHEDDNGDVIMTNQPTGTSVTGFKNHTQTAPVSGSVDETNKTVDTLSDYELYFTYIEDYTTEGVYIYTIQNSEGKYLTFSGNNRDYLAFTDTFTTLRIGYNGDYIAVRSDSDTSYQFIDYYAGNGKVFGSWESTNNKSINEVLGKGNAANTEWNKKHLLYSLETEGASDSQRALYNALKDGITYEPGTYSAATYGELLEALSDGYDIYNSEYASDADFAAAVERINNAIANLGIDIRTFPATIYKYGYDPDGTTALDKYSGGGQAFNELAYTEMKKLMLDNDNIMSQIKTVIGYNSMTANGRDAALDTAVTEYAKVYTLWFTGAPMTTEGANTNISNDNYHSFWNYWKKPNTHIDGFDDNGDQGASVQGLFSTTLKDGLPGTHIPYTGTLEYKNTNGDGLDSNRTLTLDGKQVTLTPLNNISVYIYDYFSKTDLVAPSTDGDYAKYYWDTQFPFITTSNEYGVETYTYDSADSTHVFQASYDDASHTAQSQLSTVDTDWNVNRHTKDPGKGFFPFNYQLDGDNSDLADTEDAIYHFGMSFSTEFYIPAGGTYADGNDIVFEFSGDDDVLVYIDGVLVLDNGGLHGARSMSINFTDCSVSYQYIADVATNSVINDTANITYTYGQTNEGISTQNQAAIEKLNQVKTDGNTHTLQFYYLERGSTDSNCKIQFNLQKISDYISLTDQTLVVDYGLPVEYDITENNTYKAGTSKDNVEYIGYVIGTESPDAVVFGEENLTEDVIRFTNGKGTYENSKGTFEMDSSGHVKFTPDKMQFDGKNDVYICAKITNDPTYAADVEYFILEKVTIVPATVVYYEDTFCEGTGDGIQYTDGSTATGAANTESYGIWQTAGTEKTDAVQHADIAGAADANVYGYDQAYQDCATYSNGSSHYVTVSAANNPNQQFSGGAGASWPEAQFTFAGTGFDIVSVTSGDTGFANILVYKGTDTTGELVKNLAVDTYYGYNYGRVYADEAGEPTLTITDMPMYFAPNKISFTVTPTYYADDGSITYDNPDGTLEKALAYGWIEDKNAQDNALYQIPVMNTKDLEYGVYTVVVIPMYSSVFDHQKDDGSYEFYLDGIRIYNPAGTGTTLTDATISEAYRNDRELNPDVLELRDIIISQGVLSTDGTTENGIVFVDGKDNVSDVSEYETVGPNNEIYLSQGQAIAFEIWSTTVPTDIFLGTKLIKGTPNMTITYETSGGRQYSFSKDIATSTDSTYSIEKALFAQGGNFAWTTQEIDSVTYYSTGTVVIMNNSADADSVLSLTNIRWAFANSGFGQAPVEATNAAAPAMMRAMSVVADDVTADSDFMLMSSINTVAAARSAIGMMNADLEIPSENVELGITDIPAGGDIVLNIKTSTDVFDLVIKDSQGNVIEPAAIESAVKVIDNENVKMWTVTLEAGEAGVYTYYITGVYENGYTDGSAPAVITVTVTEADNEETLSFFEKLIGLFKKIIEFFKKLVEMLTSM